MTPRHKAERSTDHFDDQSWIMLDGRLFFVAGYTSGGAPFGMFADEMPPHDEPRADKVTPAAGDCTVRPGATPCNH